MSVSAPIDEFATAPAALLEEDGYFFLPAVQTDEDGQPRFVIAGADAATLTAVGRVETSVGVDAELRNFLDDALLPGDWYVDLEPGHGFAALAAATALAQAQVLVVHDDPATRSAIARSADRSRCAERVRCLPRADAESALPLLDAASLMVLHAGRASTLAANLTVVRSLLQRDDVGVVAWSCAADEETDVRIASRVLELMGFAHFALIDGAAGVELVPADAVGREAMRFSLSDGFIARLNGTAPAKRAVSAAAEPMSRAQRIQACASELLAAVQEDLMPGAALLGRPLKVGDIATAEIEGVWPQATVVSFDIFDTLLVRLVAHPTDVFLHLSGVHPFTDVPLTPAALAAARQAAERTARGKGVEQRASTEVTLTEIHTELARTLGWPATRVPAMVDAEHEVELRLCRAHPTLNHWFDRASRDGKSIWCISDTYHEAAFLQTLLERCGYSMRGVRVVSSADARCSKADGRLFTKVLNETGTPASSVVHIGDHPLADADNPTRLGINAVLHPWAAARHTDAPADTPADSVALGLAMIGARTYEPLQPFWWRFGFAVAGPLFTGFALWLEKRFAAEGIDRAYFLLRDGEILEAVYRVVAGASPGPATALLESSRRAYSLPALEAERASLLSQLTATENPRPVREFLGRLGIDTAPLAGDFRAAGFSSPDDLIAPATVWRSPDWRH